MQLSVFFVSLVYILTAYPWSTARNFGIQDADDLNPQACREQVYGHTCVVWQTNLNGNWDIFSRFGRGPYWGDTTLTDTFRVTADAASDVNPCVIHDGSRSCYWCVWQNDGTGYWNIFVAQTDTSGAWLPPYQLTTTDADDESPSAFMVAGTVWVVWQSQDSVSTSIYSAFYDGGAWSSPIPVIVDSAGINRNPKICNRHNYPFIVWEKEADIYYSEYINDSWQTPVAITSDAYNNINPDIGVENSYEWGVWITWQTDRHGNYDIYRTAYDTLDIHYPVTSHDSADITPNFMRFAAPAKNERIVGECVAFTTSRNGSDDIYTYWVEGFYGLPDTLTPVDLNSSEDNAPAMTGSFCYLMILWQSDRNADWDIYGCYTAISSIEETNAGNKVTSNNLTITPNPFSTMTTINFGDIQRTHGIELKIFDATGYLVKELLQPTAYSLVPASVTWDGRNDQNRILPSGVYFLELNAGGSSTTEKVLLVR